MAYINCPECKDYHYSSEPCAPTYTVYHEDHTDDFGMLFRGHSHHEAAMKYADHYNSDEYDLMGTTINVEVEDIHGQRKKFRLSAEPSVDYSAKEIN